MHWHSMVLAVRGEIPEAREGSATLLALAQARGDRPALLTAFRAVGLMTLLTGRIVEAREMTEQTVKEVIAMLNGRRLVPQVRMVERRASR